MCIHGLLICTQLFFSKSRLCYYDGQTLGTEIKKIGIGTENSSRSSAGSWCSCPPRTQSFFLPCATTHGSFTRATTWQTLNSSISHILNRETRESRNPGEHFQKNQQFSKTKRSEHVDFRVKITSELLVLKVDPSGTALLSNSKDQERFPSPRNVISALFLYK